MQVVGKTEMMNFRAGKGQGSVLECCGFTHSEVKSGVLKGAWSLPFRWRQLSLTSAVEQ